MGAGYDDITLAQGRIAARLGERGSRLTELADAAQVTKQTAGYLVDQLERAGYVERRPDPTDARARLVCLSDRGRAVQREARTVERRIAREWSRHPAPSATGSWAPCSRSCGRSPTRGGRDRRADPAMMGA